MPMNPTSDMVAVAWLGGVPGLLPSLVATTLPRDHTTWATSGFVTVAAIAGTTHMYLPVRQPVTQVDCWAVNPNSNQPPWGKANQFAERIRSHVEEHPRPTSFYRLLTFPQGDYHGAQVTQAIMRTEPRRGIVQGISPTGDEASYAHYLFDLELWWRVAT